MRRLRSLFAFHRSEWWAGKCQAQLYTLHAWPSAKARRYGHRYLYGISITTAAGKIVAVSAWSWLKGPAGRLTWRMA